MSKKKLTIEDVMNKYGLVSAENVDVIIHFAVRVMSALEDGKVIVKQEHAICSAKVEKEQLKEVERL